MHAPRQCIQKIIINLIEQQLPQAMFWNDVMIAYSGMTTGYSGRSRL